MYIYRFVPQYSDTKEPWWQYQCKHLEKEKGQWHSQLQHTLEQVYCKIHAGEPTQSENTKQYLTPTCWNI